MYLIFVVDIEPVSFDKRLKKCIENYVLLNDEMVPGTYFEDIEYGMTIGKVTLKATADDFKIASTVSKHLYDNHNQVVIVSVHNLNIIYQQYLLIINHQSLL